jgi:hypothetical protein
VSTRKRSAGTTRRGAARTQTSTTPHAGMKLPHERDESAERDTSVAHGGDARPEIEQGASDVEAGQRDTDCYTASAPRYAKHERKRR